MFNWRSGWYNSCDYLCWGVDILYIHQRKNQLVSIWGMWFLMSIWITLLPFLCINSGLCCLVCSPSSFLINLSTIIVQLNMTLIQFGFRWHIVITFMTHWWCVIFINLTNILVIVLLAFSIIFPQLLFNCMWHWYTFV